MSLQNDLDRIAELQGKSVPRGDRIDGFGPSDPPPPVGDPIPSARERYGAPIEDDFDDEMIAEEPPASPLIPRVAPAIESTEIMRHALTVRRTALEAAGALGVGEEPYVDGPEARVGGRDVTLNESEVASVKNIVLRAIQRVVAADLKAIAGLLPRRKRVSRSAGAAPAPAPARRGRPKKVKP